MEELTRGLIELLRSSVRIAFVVVLASGILLFAPTNWLAKMRVDQFVGNYGDVVGLVFVVSVALVLVEPLSWLGVTLKSKYVECKLRKKIKSAICELDEREKKVLWEFYLEKRHTLLLPADHPVVAGLISKGILEIVGPDREVWDGRRQQHRCPIRISFEVSRHLSPEMSGLPSEPTEEELREIRRRRANFL
jgi:hypothetical protein